MDAPVCVLSPAVWTTAKLLDCWSAHPEIAEVGGRGLAIPRHERRIEKLGRVSEGRISHGTCGGAKLDQATSWAWNHVNETIFFIPLQMRCARRLHLMSEGRRITTSSVGSPTVRMLLWVTRHETRRLFVGRRIRQRQVTVCQPRSRSTTFIIKCPRFGYASTASPEARTALYRAARRQNLDLAAPSLPGIRGSEQSTRARRRTGRTA